MGVDKEGFLSFVQNLLLFLFILMILDKGIKYLVSKFVDEIKQASSVKIII